MEVGTPCDQDGFVDRNHLAIHAKREITERRIEEKFGDGTAEGILASVGDIVVIGNSFHLITRLANCPYMVITIIMILYII